MEPHVIYFFRTGTSCSAYPRDSVMSLCGLLFLPFYCSVAFHCMSIYNWFIYSSIHRHLSFQLLSIMKKASMNILIKVFWWTYVWFISWHFLNNQFLFLLIICMFFSCLFHWFLLLPLVLFPSIYMGLICSFSSFMKWKPVSC